ncbi:MAG TPA: type II toxin-antitoxin system prevent-host-death family antitoxin [Anaerolineales bacterium]|nr:type II toxin-antitoxin system prevent-host-death family antitoxin [Anaerolineales bacterium]
MQVTIHEAKTHLSRLIKKVLQGEEIIIAKGNQPLVKLVMLPEAQQGRRIGGAKGLIKYMAEDFDAPLEDFQEYMPSGNIKTSEV